jgi:hypothetical protein
MGPIRDIQDAGIEQERAALVLHSRIMYYPQSG